MADVTSIPCARMFPDPEHAPAMKDTPAMESAQPAASISMNAPRKMEAATIEPFVRTRRVLEIAGAMTVTSAVELETKQVVPT